MGKFYYNDLTVRSLGTMPFTIKICLPQVDDIVEELKTLTLTEAAELVKAGRTGPGDRGPGSRWK